LDEAVDDEAVFNDADVEMKERTALIKHDERSSGENITDSGEMLKK
jgi:hypothetical protein